MSEQRKGPARHNLVVGAITSVPIPCVLLYLTVRVAPTRTPGSGCLGILTLGGLAIAVHAFIQLRHRW